MKTKATTATLSLALLLFAAVGARAQEGILAPAGSPYLINSTTDATAVNPVTYQWYRNGSPISGATSASYTVPAAQANGSSVEFKRHVSTQGCSGELEGYSNTVVVTFVNLLLNGVRWADANVDSYQTFAAKPDVYTKHYQWNKTFGYAATGTVSPAWEAAANTDATWTNNPCPTGWRLPSKTEMEALLNSGYTYAAANDRGNSVGGFFLGSRHSSCSLSGSMAGCIFIPACGYRYEGNPNNIVYQGSRMLYWCGTSTGNNGDMTNTDTYAGTPPNNRVASVVKNNALALRCVQ